MILNTVKPLRTWALALIVLAASGCGSTGDGQDGGPLIVVSTTMLGDLVTAVAGDDATVDVLMPRGVDPHDFQPSAQQIARVATADLVVFNGLGLEESLEDAIRTSAGVILEVAEEVDPLPFSHADEDPGADTPAGSDHEHGEFDPHVWLDPVRMATATMLVAETLAGIDPQGGYRQRGEAYAARLLAAHAEIEQILEPLTESQRLLVTNHEAFGYFAARYGFTIIGTVVPGGSTLAEPSSTELAALVEAIREHQVTAIFAETTQPLALAEAIAAEVGSQVRIVELYSESLGEPGGGADTLPLMLVENARRIAGALEG